MSDPAPQPPQGERKSGLPDHDRKATKAEMRQGGMVATVVLILLALFTTAFIWIAG